MKLFIVGLSFLVPCMLSAQTPASKPDSSRPKTGLKPYAEIITAKAKTSRGLFLVHNVNDRYYFEIGDTLLGRDIMIVNRISQAAADARSGMLGFAGDQINQNVVRFEKGPANKLFIRTISFTEMSSDSSRNGMYRSVLNNNIQPIAASFDIKTTSPNSVVIDMTDYLNGDNDILFFDSRSKSALRIGSVQSDRSYIQSVSAYPMNVEIKTVKTYSRTPQITPNNPMPSPGGFSTYELNSSIVLLPTQLMRTRAADARVGYFSTGYTDFDADAQRVRRTTMITRWKLEPRPEDQARYLRGEKVEPVKPIVIYIDPETPRKWVPYLIQGVNDWQVAFEQAGFKNAIYALEAPANDSSWSLEDARHSAIVYKPSAIPNASGPNVNDPRSGEILETHINWYHNVMQLIHDWYLIQAGPLDSNARTMNFPDELMGQLIRFVSSHEVGHTLGLRHNFGSSSTVPVEKLRDKAWVEAHGHTPSIMDYARFNYVAQPEDHISTAGIFPRIGDYDKWAIEWGYRWWPEMDKNAERAKLNKWVIDSLGSNNRLFFGSERDSDDPRSQSEDVGDDAVKAGRYGIANLKRIMPKLRSWSLQPNMGYADLTSLYGSLLNQFFTYMGHAVTYIGGVYTTPKTAEQEGLIYTYVPKQRQKQALDFLQEQLFTTPTWLTDPKISGITGQDDAVTFSSMQESILRTLFSSNTMNKLLKAEVAAPAQAYPAYQMYNDLRAGIFSELAANTTVTAARRNLQKAYVEKMLAFLAPPAVNTITVGFFNAPVPASKTNDGISIIKGHARELQAQLIKAAAISHDTMTRLHYLDCADRIKTALKNDKD